MDLPFDEAVSRVDNDLFDSVSLHDVRGRSEGRRLRRVGDFDDVVSRELLMTESALLELMVKID